MNPVVELGKSVAKSKRSEAIESIDSSFTGNIQKIVVVIPIRARQDKPVGIRNGRGLEQHYGGKRAFDVYFRRKKTPITLSKTFPKVKSLDSDYFKARNGHSRFCIASRRT